MEAPATEYDKLKAQLAEVVAKLGALPKGVEYFNAEQERQRLVTAICVIETGEEPVF